TGSIPGGLSPSETGRRFSFSDLPPWISPAYFLRNNPLHTNSSAGDATALVAGRHGRHVADRSPFGKRARKPTSVPSPASPCFQGTSAASRHSCIKESLRQDFRI